MLLMPLEEVRQSRRYHPEGDALYHSLQVYELARDEMPWDLEFQLAALLHDVGKGIDAADHVNAGLFALAGLIGERTAWLIKHHMDGGKALDGELTGRLRRRLIASEWWQDLLALARCDRGGRVPGIQCISLDEALGELRTLQIELGAWDSA